MINKITKRGKRLEKDKKLHYRWSMLRNSQISYGKEIARRPATSNEQVIETKGTVWRTRRQVCLSYRWKKHLAGFPHLGVVDRWLATPKRARIAH